MSYISQINTRYITVCSIQWPNEKENINFQFGWDKNKEQIRHQENGNHGHLPEFA